MRLRFVAAAGTSGTAIIGYRAWDQTEFANEGRIDLTAPNVLRSTGSLSSQVAQAVLTVTNV